MVLINARISINRLVRKKMFYQYLSNVISSSQILCLAAAMGFLISFVLLDMRFPFLPRDHGRDFAVNGALSKGKLRGVGVIMIPVFSLVVLLVCPVSVESIIYTVLINLVMLSGYLDDASEIPWQDYKKGAIDLAISVITMIVFLRENGTSVAFFGISFHIPLVLYFILGIILIWTAINVTNCSDGIDGLCASVSFVTIASFALLFKAELAEYADYACVLMGVMVAYLFFNTKPSSMLMGDAGSRALGYAIALLAMKSRHPFSYIILSLVLILDGGLGLIKVSVIRFLHKNNFMKNIRTPIHDELRSKSGRGWSDMQVVVRFSIVQLLISAALGIFII